MPVYSQRRKKPSESQENYQKADSNSPLTPFRLTTCSFISLFNKEAKGLQFKENSTQKRSRNSQILAAILVNALYEMRNYPIVLINTVLSPLSFLALIVFVSRGSLIGQAVEGGFIMSMFSSGMGLQADLSHLKNDFKLQEMVVSSPTTPTLYVAGMALSELVYSLPALAVLTVLAAIFLHPTIIGAFSLLGVMLLMFLASV